MDLDSSPQVSAARLRWLKHARPDDWLEVRTRTIVQQLVEGKGSAEVAAQIFHNACRQHARLKIRRVVGADRAAT
jgi:hypothetical protein